MALLEGKVAIITGAARGIGRACAELFAEHGARVVLSDIDAAPTHEAAEAIQAGGGVTAVVKSDARAGQYAVLIVERQGDVDVVRLRRVELGEVMGNGIAVLNGVMPGERVVVSGATLLVDGEAVHVVS